MPPATSAAATTCYFWGGLVGFNNSGPITQAYATGNVNGGERSYALGGLVGSSYGSPITQAYATGAVSGGDGSGGLVGENAGGVNTITNSYWDKETTGQSISKDSDPSAGLTTAQLQSANLPTDFDPSVWGGAAFFYPFLNFQTTVTSRTTADRTIDSGFAESVNTLLADRSVAVEANAVTVAAPLTWVSGKTLSLNAYNAIAINAPITITGAGGVALTYNTALPTNLNFGIGGWIDYGTADRGGTLVINNQAYTLVYTMAQLDAIDGVENIGGTPVSVYGPGLSGRYALATNLDASGTTYTKGLIAGGDTSGNRPSPFSGTLEGLGHSISNLTIAGGDMYFVGLLGYSTGTVRDIGVTGGSVVGNAVVGGLVGWNNGGTITQAYATGAVSGGDGALYLGGLVGVNVGGRITQSYATGAVSGENDTSALGGLVGWNDGMITQTYATGVVSGGNGASHLGGLVGVNDGGMITQSYATGAVGGGNGAQNLGGLVGVNQDVGTISSSYWNTQTTGQSTSAGSNPAAGLTTAQLQSGNLADLQGFDSSVWATGAGLYPYLKNFFPNGVQVVTGFANRSDSAPMASGVGGAVSVNVVNNGAVVGSATTGTNGYYYVFMQPGTLVGSSGYAAYTQANGVTAQDSVSYHAGVANAVLNTDLDIAGNSRWDTAGSLASLSALDGGFATTIGGTAPSGFTLPNRLIANAGNFSLDKALAVTGTLALTGPGNVTQTAAITASQLLLNGTGAFALTNAGNAIGAVAANVGSLHLASNTALTISAVIASGGVHVTTPGNLTIAKNGIVTGANPVLSAGEAFINNSGSNAVSATSGRWLIYSANPSGNTFGNLDSANTAIWNTASDAAVGATGNRYVFALQPTLTVTSLSKSKVYGEDVTADIAAGYTITGYNPGIIGAYLGDTAATAVTGAASVTSTGAAATANVAGSPYAVTAKLGSLASPLGYAFDFVNSGVLTVTPASLTITASDATKVYGQQAALSGFSAIGLQNDETVGSVSLASLGAAATANVADSPYAIAAIAASGGTFNAANYSVGYVDGHLTMTPASLTITASDATKSYDGQAWSGGNGVSYSGFVNGEDATVLGGTSHWGGTAQGQTNAGLYTIAASGLTSGNYAISYVDGHLTVTPAALTITADAQSRPEGTANPALTYQVDGTLFNHDTIIGDLETSATTASMAGFYPITQGTLAVSSNYRLTYQGGLFTVVPADVPVVPSPPIIDASLLASSIVRDNFDLVSLPDDASPVFGVPSLTTSLGIGVFYADPRFDNIFVCFGSGRGTAQACFAANR